MRNRWSESEAAKLGGADPAERPLALLAYATHLIGAEPDLAMHGGGNTSCKGTLANALGEVQPALFIKSSGMALADAYSATKAASHQLARIASLEFAPLGVRVNMVSPDAVFSHGDKRSGLWAAVGPNRMKARGLDERGLEEYYRSRNLLKAQVTADHVARAVLFFLTHQTPTTGATIPVDGGLPDATPR
jgi:NAD(P)-dependent dehydrogenase (short-subunit alcohol dehydrogenase family)